MLRNLQHKLRFYYTLIALGIITVSALLFGFLVLAVERFTDFQITKFPTMLFVILVSVILGTFFAFMFSRRILSPITKLDEALQKVAAGDFTVRLDTETRIDVIRNIYNDFNLMARELSATETLRSDFVSNVSHEFKTPINAIEGYAMLLQDPGQEAEERAECAEKILVNARRLSELVGNILLISRVENQNMPFEQTVYRLDEQIREAIVMLEPNWSEKQLDFDVDLQRIEYCGTEKLLYHVWSNLIGNAVKFSYPEGLIKIRLYMLDGAVVFKVADAGPGISVQEQSHIFEKFYQADTSHKSEGNGLGLALVKKILDVLGGRIEVHSDPGFGAAFTVSLPVRRAPEKGARTSK